MNTAWLAADRLIAKAGTALSDAEAALSEERWEAAVNRAYYAAFRIVSAALATRDLAFSKHGAVIGEFNRLFVHGGVVAPHVGGDLNRLFELRQRADYDYQRDMNKGLATEAVTTAQVVVGEVLRALEALRPSE